MGKLSFSYIVSVIENGEYKDFKKFCLLIIVVGIVIYTVPQFYLEGLMSLPAVSMIFSGIFIVKG